MKKPYQIEAQRAVRQLEEMATDGNPAVQMVLPMAEMVGWLRQGVGALKRQAGLGVMELLITNRVARGYQQLRRGPTLVLLSVSGASDRPTRAVRRC
jgi:hypothetical protein